MENSNLNRQRELEEALARKEQELKKLETRVNELESKLLNKGANTDDLLKYYLNKYDSYYDEIIQLCEEERAQSKKKLEKEIEELQKAKSEAENLLKKNEVHQQNIEKLTNQNTEVKNKITAAMDQKNQAVDEFLKDINQMNFETDQMYLNVLSQFNDAINSRISFDELFEHLDLYQTYLETKGFDKAQEIKKCHEKLKESQTEIDQKIEKLEDKLESLKVQIEQEKTQLIDTNLFDIEDQLFNKQSTYQDFDKQSDKICNKFAGLKNRHHNNFKDVLYKLKLYNYAPAEIGREFEKLLDLFVQELNMVDGDDYELRQREIASLKERIDQIEKEKVELPALEEELKELQSTYSKAHAEITEMERYIAKCNPLIEPSSRYYEWYVSLKALQDKMNRLAEEKEEQTNYIKELYRERKKLVYDPFAKDSLKSLDEKILSEEAKLQTIMTSIDDTMTVWKTIDNNPEQARFKSIINQKTKFEDRLPVLYQSLNELKQVIDEKYNKVTEIKERVVTLDRLYEEIGNLENEDNN